MISQGGQEHAQASGVCLLARVGSRICAFPVEHVSETMRPLPIEPLAGMPVFVLGVTVVRGTPMPVIDVARMLGATDPPCPGKFVSLRVGARGAVVAIDAVLGVRSLSCDSLGAVPPLFAGENAEVIETMGRLDSALLLILRSGRLVPNAVWAAMRAQESS